MFEIAIESLILGLVLSSDSFAAALAMGQRPFKRKDALTFALCSGAAEAFSALFGSLAGQQIVKKFSEIDHWIAFSLLLLVSLHMAYEGVDGIKNKKEENIELAFHSIAKVLLVSFATSLDAFGVGIGLGVSNRPLLPILFSIGFWAFTSTLVGLFLSKKFSNKFGPGVNILGAIILAGLAFKMLSI